MQMRTRSICAPFIDTVVSLNPIDFPMVRMSMIPAGSNTKTFDGLFRSGSESTMPAERVGMKRSFPSEEAERTDLRGLRANQWNNVPRPHEEGNTVPGGTRNRGRVYSKTLPLKCRFLFIYTFI